MDFISCKICQVPYDEDDHRPRNSPCGHELCNACLGALIKDSIFECPKCRQKNKVDVPGDLPVCYGLIDVIRAFKTKNISVTEKDESRIPGASNEDVCSIHYKSISHWCSKCQLWICLDCLESHIQLIGCATTSSTKAVKDMKDNQNKTIDQLLTNFERHTSQISSKIQEHIGKRDELIKKIEEHDEEVKKLRNALQDGAKHKDKLVESKSYLNETNSPHAVHDRIKVVTQRKQVLLSWAAKNLGMETSLESHKGFLEFDQLQKMSPSNASLVFLEISQGGVVKGQVLLRLTKDLPNISQYLIQLVTGEYGDSLKGIRLVASGKRLYKDDLKFKKNQVTTDPFRDIASRKGHIYGCFSKGYLNHLYINLGNSFTCKSGWYIFASIEKGMGMLENCYNNSSSDINISDCGLVIEHD